MGIFSFIFLFIFSITTGVLAEVDQRLIDNVYAMTGSNYKKDGNPISRPVQTVNMLAHELSLYADERMATAAAKSIISMVTKGEGVKGLREVTHRSRRRFLNEIEKELIIHAVTKAANYLQHLDLLDPFLEGSIGSMAGVWNSDDSTRKHGSVVLSLLMAAREKAATDYAPQIYIAKAAAITMDGAEAIHKTLEDPDVWHYAEDYMTGPTQTHRYNAIAWKSIERDRNAELEGDRNFSTRIPTKFPVRALTPEGKNVKFLNDLAKELERTLIPEKAATLSKQIMDSVRDADTDLRTLADPGGNQFHQAVVRALMAVEKFRMFVIGTDAVRPTVFDYVNNGQNPESQAALIALVSAIQNYLYNPSSKVASLKKLFSYQSNDRHLAYLQGALSAVNLDIFINEDFTEALSNPIRINYLQEILIDQENLKQRLKFFWMPTFNKEAGQIIHEPTFVRYYGSSGSSNQCGFFSLGYKTRDEAKRQILDNLQDPKIFELANTISATSEKIRKLMEEIKSGTVNAETNILLAKIKANQGLTEGGEALKARVLALYKQTSTEIKEEIDKINSAIDQEKRESGFLEKIPDREKIALWIMIHKDDRINFDDLKGISKRVIEDDAVLDVELSTRSNGQIMFPITHDKKGSFEALVTREIFTIADQIVTKLSDELRVFIAEQRMFKTIELDSRLTKLFYSLTDFQEIIAQDMHNVFAQSDSGKTADVDQGESSELLEFPPNPEWRINIPSYPFLMAKLNNYSIGGWTSKNYLRILQAGRVDGDEIVPLYETEDGKEYALVSYISTTEDAKRIDVTNLGGGHFEKLIRAGDRPQAVRALLHVTTYGRAGLTRDTRPIRLF